MVKKLTYTTMNYKWHSPGSHRPMVYTLAYSVFENGQRLR